jgi:hypothetical protein
MLNRTAGSHHEQRIQTQERPCRRTQVSVPRVRGIRETFLGVGDQTTPAPILPGHSWKCLPGWSQSILLYGFAVALLLNVSVGKALAASASSLTPARSGNDLTLSFPTTSPNLHTLQTSPDLVQPWTNYQSGVVGDGTVKTVTVANAFVASQGFYRLFIETPMKLLMSQGAAFAVLGYDCGGIAETVYVTGFDPTNGNVAGDVYLRTVCSCGKDCSSPHSAWATATWDFGGNTIAYGALSNAPTIDPTFMATDAYDDTIYNVSNAIAAAYLAVPTPAAPTNVIVVQTNDQFDITWTTMGVNPLAVTSSVLTATPINSTNSVLTTNVTGSTSGGVIQPLQPGTTYQITVVNTSIGGDSPTSTPINVTSSSVPIPPSAPTWTTNYWSNPDGGDATNNTIVSIWRPAVPGDSPVDQYLIVITSNGDGSATDTNTVDGSTLTTYFTVDNGVSWSVTVQAHNSFGWGPASVVYRLGGQ